MLYYQQRILRKNGACLCLVLVNFGRGRRYFFFATVNALQELQSDSLGTGYLLVSRSVLLPSFPYSHSSNAASAFAEAIASSFVITCGASCPCK
jgi:hypothetical protein